jgi:teichuronic acid biosynthesis glycosyltransferase TuaH
VLEKRTLTESLPETAEEPPVRVIPAAEYHRGLVVVCAANNYDTVRVADQHMADRLAGLTPLLYVDPPLSHLSPRNNPQLAGSLKRPRLRRTPAGFWRLTPVVPPRPMTVAMRPLTQRLVRRALSRAVKTIGSDVAAVVTAWPSLDVFGACNERLRVWWAQDDFAAGADLMGQIAERVAAGERARADQSDLIVAANPEIDCRLRARGYDVELIPYGSDPESFSMVGMTQAGPSVGLDPPTAVLVGQLNERVDPALLEAVADRGISLLIVGPAVDGHADWLNRLTSRPNVRWVGGQPFDALPGFLSRASVGLVPYADTAFNRGSFPLKALEYLAAGLPVASTDLPFARWLGADRDLIRIADAPQDFAEAVASLASLPVTPASGETRRAFAREHSYDRRARELLDAIETRLVGRPASDQPTPARTVVHATSPASGS